MSKRRLALFDLDGTLSPARKSATPEMAQLLQKLQKFIPLAVVSGSDLPKVQEQLGPLSGELFDYLFVENGVLAYKKNELIHSKNFPSLLGEDRLKKIINFTLKYFSELEIPVKRGTFIECRTSMLNLCPIGRSCSYEERNAFVKLDQKEGIRQKFVDALNKEFWTFPVQFALGGQISVDCFLKGCDKRYCLQFIESEYDEIYFFGDKVFKGGNDHEIYKDPRTLAYEVRDPEHTAELINKLFLNKEL
ncbi:phosphomannomutase [Cardiosporidium cionae]|uniref:Phosphomannomutase n=1 Tax=Cardiosporidium cionae TaxID=476202 RepID=A0ABQ7JC23_9APIC|nr:phosphomannomutase [Cardiosporidium cionae]|eukprot:KAF8821215.1 phosphomannomutase [Cardiosporidium cionae]